MLRRGLERWVRGAFGPWRQMSVENVLRVLPPWLVGAAGMACIFLADRYDAGVLMVLGVALFVVGFLFFARIVVTIIVVEGRALQPPEDRKYQERDQPSSE